MRWSLFRAMFCATIFSANVGSYGASASTSQAWAAAETVAFQNGHWFDGDGFAFGTRWIRAGRFVPQPGTVDRAVDLGGRYVTPPLGDAHTHHFDGPFGFEAQNRGYLENGVFYVMNHTAPTRGVQAIRDRLFKPDSVDVSTSTGGLTGPNSHPREVYERLALHIFNADEFEVRNNEVRASYRMEDNAYYIIDSEADLESKWPVVLAGEPDFIKIFSQSYPDDVRDTLNVGWQTEGIDEELVGAIVERAEAAGLRSAIVGGRVFNIELALANRASMVSHMPCYMVAPLEGIYAQPPQTDETCLITSELAERAAESSLVQVHWTSGWREDLEEFGLEQSAQIEQWQIANLRILEDAGSPIAIGSDLYGVYGGIEGLVALAGRNILPNARLLEIAVMDTPQIIFPDRRIGCLEVGCEASFLVLAADPIEDFAALRAIEMRIKDGLLLTLPSSEEE